MATTELLFVPCNFLMHLAGFRMNVLQPVSLIRQTYQLPNCPTSRKITVRSIKLIGKYAFIKMLSKLNRVNDSRANNYLET